MTFCVGWAVITCCGCVQVSVVDGAVNKGEAIRVSDLATDCFELAVD